MYHSSGEEQIPGLPPAPCRELVWRPKPHVIYPATSPTNYSLHTAAENQQPHTFLRHTQKRPSGSERASPRSGKTQNAEALNTSSARLRMTQAVSTFCGGVAAAVWSCPPF